MGELGPQAARFHAEIGKYARSIGVERLFAVGPLSGETVAAFGAGAEEFADLESLIGTLRPLLHTDVNLLVKGSRSMGMERIVAALAETLPDRAAEGAR